MATNRNKRKREKRNKRKKEEREEITKNESLSNGAWI
jgi:hypothetical protein